MYVLRTCIYVYTCTCSCIRTCMSLQISDTHGSLLSPYFVCVCVCVCVCDPVGECCVWRTRSTAPCSQLRAGGCNESPSRVRGRCRASGTWVYMYVRTRTCIYMYITFKGRLKHETANFFNDVYLKLTRCNTHKNCYRIFTVCFPCKPERSFPSF